MASNACRVWCADDVAKAMTLHRSGMRVIEIAERLGRSRGGVSKVLNVNGIYQRKGKASGNSIFDGPAIGATRDDERRIADAQIGSQRLLAAIQCAGVRP